MAQQEKFQDLKILGNQPALDFTNTVDWRGREKPHDYINNYNDLIDWAEYTELIDQIKAATIREKASKNPQAASETYNRVKDFREAAYKTFYQLSIDGSPSVEDKNLIETEMRKMFSRTHLDLSGKKLELEDDATLDHILSIIVKETIEILTSDELDRVKRCQSEECGWLFIDTSKNNSRKWCQMRSCGNRAKARRYYSRTKQ